MARGYLNSSPFEALTLAIIMQTIFRITRVKMMGNPIIMKQSGTTRTIYKSNESWKFNEAFPFSFTHVDSSFLDNQQIKGPIIPPKGNRKPAKAARWQNIAQFLSVSDNTLISFMTFRFLLKDGTINSMLHDQNLARRFKSDSNNPFGFLSSIICWS